MTSMLQGFSQPIQIYCMARSTIGWSRQLNRQPAFVIQKSKLKLGSITEPVDANHWASAVGWNFLWSMAYKNRRLIEATG